MMGQDFLGEEDKNLIQAQLSSNIDKIGNTLQQSLDLISSLTNYTSVGIFTATIEKKRVIKNISLVAIDENAGNRYRP